MGYSETPHVRGSTASDKIDLSPLREGRTKPPVLPLELFGPWSDWIARTAEGANAPEDYVAASLLSAASVAIGNARWAYAWQGWAEPPVLWIGLVGDPSSGKSPATDAVHTTLRRIEAEELAKFEPELRAHEERCENAAMQERAWRETARTAVANGDHPPPKPDAAIPPNQIQCPRCVVGDTTPEALAAILSGNPRGLLVKCDELAGWLTGMDRYSNGGGSGRAFYVEAYGGRSFTVDRKGGGAILIPHLSVSIVGGIQPDRFARLIVRADDDGLASRFLFVWPEVRPFKRPDDKANEGVLYVALKKLRALPMARDENRPTPTYVQCSPEAQAVLVEFCREHGAASPDGSAIFRNWRGKGRGHVLRLALILEYLDWAASDGVLEPGVVSEAAMVRAIALYTEYFVPMAERVFGDAALPEAERDAGAVARLIVKKRSDKVKVRELYRDRVGGMSTAARAHKAIEVLVDAGWLIEASTREGLTPGRKQKTYDIDHNLWRAIEAEKNG